MLQQVCGTARRALGNVCGCCCCCSRGGRRGGKLSRPLLIHEGCCDEGISPQTQLGPSRQASRIWWPCARSATSATEETVGVGSLAQSATNGQSLPQHKTLRVAKTWRWLFSARAATAEQPEPHCSSVN